MHSRQACAKLFLLLVLLPVQASAFSEYSHLLPEKQVDLLPLLVIPASCDEFLSTNEALLAEGLPLGGETHSAYSLNLQAANHLANARKIAVLQQFHWAATPNAFAYYAAASYLCHAQALAALEKTIQASKLLLKATGEEIAALEFEAGAPQAGLKAASALARKKDEERALAEGSADAPIARLLLSAGRKTSASWDNALSSTTGIVGSVAENFKLFAALAQFKLEAGRAAEELQARLLGEQSAFSVDRAVARSRLQFVREEELEQVADEWFAFLPSGSVAVSGAEPSFRETVRSALLDFEEAEALAGEAAKTVEARKQGWAGKAFELYRQAARKAGSSLAHGNAAEERSLALEKRLSESVAQQDLELYEKAERASTANPFASAYAHSVARQTSLSFEELAGAPRGKKIREFVGLLKKLREASEAALQTPSFRWALEFLEEQVADAKRLREAAHNSGVETSFYEKQLRQAGEAVAQLKSSGSEDYELATSISETVLGLKNSLGKQIGGRFAGLEEKLALLGELKQFLSEEDGKQLELRGRATFGEATEIERTASLGESGEWADAKLAELSARAGEIVAEHLKLNARSRQSLQSAQLDAPAEGEVFWSVEHALPLDSQERMAIEIPELEGATELAVAEKSEKIAGLAGASLALSGSSQGEKHFARISFRKIVAKKTGEKTSSLARGNLLEKRTVMEFSSRAATRVLFEKRVSQKTSVRLEASGVVESFEKGVEAEPGKKIVSFSVEAREGANAVEFVEETPHPVSVSKSVFSDDAAGKLSVLYEISNELDEEITGLQLDLQESIACLEGKATVSSNAAQSVEQKRSGPLVATRLNGMRFAPSEKHGALLEVQCNSVSRYARAKLQELAADPQAPVHAGQELSEAQKAFHAGQFAQAAGLAAKAENKIALAQSKRESFVAEKNALAAAASSLESEALDLVNASTEAGDEELAKAGGQAVARARKALALLEKIFGEAVRTGEEQKILGEAAGELESGKQVLSQTSRLVEEQVAGVLRECASSGGESSKALVCVGSRELAWKAREKLLLEKPGGALRLLDKAKTVLSDWRGAREKTLVENRALGEQLREAASAARALLEKTGKALGAEAGEAGGRRVKEFRLASSARNALEAVLAKAEKLLKIFESGEENKVIELDSRSVVERRERLENSTLQLESALAAVQLLSEREVEAAQRRSAEFGDGKSAETVSKAKESLQQGSLVTAFALASGVNDELGRQKGSRSVFGARDAVLAASGIAILILLAFVFTRKAGKSEEEELAEAGQAALARDATEKTGSEQAESKQGMESSGRKPSYF